MAFPVRWRKKSMIISMSAVDPKDARAARHDFLFSRRVFGVCAWLTLERSIALKAVAAFGADFSAVR